MKDGVARCGCQCLHKKLSRGAVRHCLPKTAVRKACSSRGHWNCARPTLHGVVGRTAALSSTSFGRDASRWISRSPCFSKRDSLNTLPLAASSQVQSSAVSGATSVKPHCASRFRAKAATSAAGASIATSNAGSMRSMRRRRAAPSRVVSCSQWSWWNDSSSSAMQSFERTLDSSLWYAFSHCMYVTAASAVTTAKAATFMNGTPSGIEKSIG
mmetsp:Transcript_29052/g.89903  ORF Transcript_29052/g.89903 Transcript_29052/m.89903 type:complete len:213 (-) Transcript_29052:58-696(-)